MNLDILEFPFTTLLWLQPCIKSRQIVVLALIMRYDYALMCCSFLEYDKHHLNGFSCQVVLLVSALK